MESIGDVLKNKVTNLSKRKSEIISKVMKDAEVLQFLKNNQKQLTQEIIDRSYPQLLEFVSEKKKVEQSGYSSNKGFIPKLRLNETFIDVAFVPTEEYLRKNEIKAIKNRIHTVEMPANIKNYTFKDVDGTKERMEALKFCLDFCEGFEDHKKGAYFYGSYGVGKTYLLGALAGELAQKGINSYLAHFPSLVVELKASISNNSVNDKINLIKEAQVLMLDDIGGESLTQWVRDDILMVILDYRMRYQLPTFFTSNLNLEQLEEHFKGTNIEDERKAKRLLERVKSLSVFVRIGGANRRI